MHLRRLSGAIGQEFLRLRCATRGFEKTLKMRGLPIEISEVRQASDPLSATAKGALIAALYEK